MNIIDCEQGTEEWHEARLGIPTASNFSKIITTTGTPSKQAEKYLYKVAGEFIAGSPEETYSNFAMERGTQLEEEARSFYEMIKDAAVEQVGFCRLDYAGCSPDGLVGDKGLIEIKCPLVSTHVGYLLEDELPKDYFQQVQGQLLITGREWCDFISYYPKLKPLIVRVERDEEFLEKLEVELKMFHDKLQDVIKQIR